MMMQRLPILAVLAGCLLAPALAKADEGMWLFNNPPKKLLKDKYKFDATDKWLEHVQKSCVRFESGGSASFVSADGLVMTNHHVGSDALQKLGDKDKDYLKEGFMARTRAEEIKCVDEEVNVLQTIEDVTAKVNGAVKPEMSPEEAFKARQAVIAEIEKGAIPEGQEKKAKAEVVKLFQGGQYHLYKYKKYTDVRLVFAPEQQIAFFGGDPDNFEYPRFDLDVSFFRVYEDDKPVKLEHYLKWSKDGAKDDELIFVPGHPGNTDRMATMARLEYLRDKGYPAHLQRLYRMEVLLNAWGGREAENARRAKEIFFSVQNSRKARDGGLAGLLDPQLMAQKKDDEKKLRDAVAKDPKLKEAAGAWDKIAAAQKVRAETLVPYTMLEAGVGFRGTLFHTARVLVRAAEERGKPNKDRLRDYADARLDSLENDLFSAQPIHEDMEELLLADSLTYLAEQMGPDSDLVKKVLEGKSPRDRAAELIKGTKLKDVKYRKKLYGEGKTPEEKKEAHLRAKKEMEAALKTDKMLALASLIDEDARKVRKKVETQAEEVERQAYAQIDRARFAVQGASAYPDATFTLRLAFGVVKGYKEHGKDVPFQTTFAGLFERSDDHDNQPPFDLPKSWAKKKLRKDKAFLNTPCNFVCTADIIGGNSGSPVINAKGEVVGLIFDGNIQSLVLDFIYTEKEARAVAVCSPGIIEALRKVYDAEFLAEEIVGKK